MRGHRQSNTRQLNRHYQSGGGASGGGASFPKSNPLFYMFSTQGIDSNETPVTIPFDFYDNGNFGILPRAGYYEPVPTNGKINIYMITSVVNFKSGAVFEDYKIGFAPNDKIFSLRTYTSQQAMQGENTGVMRHYYSNDIVSRKNFPLQTLINGENPPSVSSGYMVVTHKREFQYENQPCTVLTINISDLIDAGVIGYQFIMDSVSHLYYKQGGQDYLKYGTAMADRSRFNIYINAFRDGFTYHDYVAFQQ